MGHEVAAAGAETETERTEAGRNAAVGPEAAEMIQWTRRRQRREGSSVAAQGDLERTPSPEPGTKYPVQLDGPVIESEPLSYPDAKGRLDLTRLGWTLTRGELVSHQTGRRAVSSVRGDERGREGADSDPDPPLTPEPPEPSWLP